MWVPFIELTPERTATERRISSHRAFEALQMGLRQFGIRVMKKEHVARRSSGRFVHLVPTSLLSAMDGPETRQLSCGERGFPLPSP